MDNAPLKRAVYSNFNNMTDEQLQDWPRTFLSEAQRENYVNQNLEIVRHYRTAALTREPVVDIAVDLAIACHGLYRPYEAGGGSDSDSENATGHNNNNNSTSTAAAAALEQRQQEERPPPVRRQRLHQQPEPIGGNEANGGNGQYMALAHIFSEAYAIRVDANSNTVVNSNNNNINNNNNNNNEQDSELNEAAMKETINTLGLRHT